MAVRGLPWETSPVDTSVLNCRNHWDCDPLPGSSPLEGMWALCGERKTKEENEKAGKWARPIVILCQAQEAQILILDMPCVGEWWG